MSKISDIPYHTLSYAYQQYFRKNTLQEANDSVSNAISQLPIFTHYSFDLSNLYGGVDGQKYTVEHPTTKARYSKKYFGKGKGVVEYTLLVNHIPLQVELIGAHEHESYYVFDIFYNNTTDLDVEIANQCGRLVANAIIYYNYSILSRLLEKYQQENNLKAIDKLLKISPVAWQHIHLSGHYTFCSNKNSIDLNDIISDFEFT